MYPLHDHYTQYCTTLNKTQYQLFCKPVSVLSKSSLPLLRQRASTKAFHRSLVLENNSASPHFFLMFSNPFVTVHARGFLVFPFFSSPRVLFHGNSCFTLLPKVWPIHFTSFVLSRSISLSCDPVQNRPEKYGWKRCRRLKGLFKIDEGLVEYGN